MCIYAGQIALTATRAPLSHEGGGGGLRAGPHHRYFTEDFLESVTMYKCIADLAGFETPFTDETMCFVQKAMGKDHINDGELADADVASAKPPQGLGITTSTSSEGLA